jgi:rhodanese-related sulfurtransferase
VPKEVGIGEVRDLVERGAQLVDVLPEQEYQTDHLPNAVNMPLKKLNQEAVEVLDRERPVIVYCWDYQ